MKDLITQNLQDRPIKIIGLGGIGAPVSLYLSKFCYSLNNGTTIHLIDGDKYELDNKSRVAFYEYGKKVLVKENELTSVFGERVNYCVLPVYVHEENIPQLLENNDLIFLCVDNHATRKLVSEFCEGLSNVLLISGGNDGVENNNTGTFGNVQIFWRKNGSNKTNAVTRFHPEIERPADHNPGDKKEESCAVAVLRIPQLAFTNLAVASAMLNTFLAWSYGKLNYEEIYLEILKAKMTQVYRKVIV